MGYDMKEVVKYINAAMGSLVDPLLEGLVTRFLTDYDPTTNRIVAWQSEAIDNPGYRFHCTIYSDSDIGSVDNTVITVRITNDAVQMDMTINAQTGLRTATFLTLPGVIEIVSLYAALTEFQTIYSGAWVYPVNTVILAKV